MLTQRKEFGGALEDFNKDFEKQKAHINRGINRYMVGITAHNIAVILVLAGRDDKAFPLFEEAVNLKRHAFGPEHPEVAVSAFVKSGRNQSCHHYLRTLVRTARFRWMSWASNYLLWSDLKRPWLYSMKFGR
jgi:hypothetical protein